MNYLICPDKFKGSLDAAGVARAIEKGVRRADPKARIDLCPLADGGEGTVAAMVAATGGRFITTRVTGPLPEMKVDATYGLLPDGTAVIEMSAASGLELLPPAHRNPLYTTTFGTGELMAHAIGSGCRRIILGIGGSATTDGGIGAAQACGFTILLEDGEPLSPTEPLCGRDLPRVLMVKQGRGEVTRGVEIVVACDVSNPLYGPNGAAYVFGPQKGASPEEVELLDRGLRQLASRTGTDHLANTPGAGAAGGLGFGMIAFFGATLQPGATLVMDTLRVRDRLADVDLCITGEGRLDSQSLSGKTPIAVARLCRELKVPCIALVGTLQANPDALFAQGLVAAFSIAFGPCALESLIAQTPQRLEELSTHVVRLRLNWGAPQHDEG